MSASISVCLCVFVRCLCCIASHLRACVYCTKIEWIVCVGVRRSGWGYSSAQRHGAGVTSRVPSLLVRATAVRATTPAARVVAWEENDGRWRCSRLKLRSLTDAGSLHARVVSVEVVVVVVVAEVGAPAPAPAPAPAAVPGAAAVSGAAVAAAATAGGAAAGQGDAVICSVTSSKSVNCTKKSSPALSMKIMSSTVHSHSAASARCADTSCSSPATRGAPGAAADTSDVYRCMNWSTACGTKEHVQ